MSFDLSAVPTCELVDELKKREGVWATSVEPYENYSITVGEEKIELCGQIILPPQELGLALQRGIRHRLPKALQRLARLPELRGLTMR